MLLLLLVVVLLLVLVVLVVRKVCRDATRVPAEEMWVTPGDTPL